MSENQQERDVELMLDAWTGDDEFRSVKIFKGCVELQQGGLFVQSFRSRRHYIMWFGSPPEATIAENRVICGTHNQEATTGATLLAALELWARLYGNYPNPGSEETQ